MLRDIPLKIILVCGFLYSGLAPLLVTVLLMLSTTKAELKDQAFRQLESVRDIKKNELQRFFDEKVSQLDVLVHDPFVLAAIKDLSAASGAGVLTGDGNTGFAAPEAYREAHGRYAGFFNHYAVSFGYDELFLMDPEHGYTFFTVKKGSDFGMRTGEIDSGLRDAWLSAARDGRIAVSETRPYPPAGNAPAQFVAAPVMDNGRIIGVAAVQISFDSIDLIMRDRSGMGQTGETYLVGPDFKMRSDSFLDPDGHCVAASFKGTVPKNGVSTAASRKALAGVTAAEIVTDYRGKVVLSCYAPVRLHGLQWAILAEIDEQEIDARIAGQLNRKIVIIIVSSLLLVLVAAFFISFIISRGIGTIVEELGTLLDSILKGRLDARGDTAKVGIDFQGVVVRTNQLIDAFVAELEEVKKLEGAVQHKQKIASLGTLAGGIAHDFNNILNYMLAYAEIVESQVERGSFAYDNIQEIIRAIERAGSLVSQILIFSSRVQPVARPMLMALIVKEAVRLLQATLPENIQVEKRITSENLFVMTDPTHAHQVIVNLCTNAIYAMQDHGGRLTVSFDRTMLENANSLDLPAGAYCRLTVADTGCGMTEEVKKRIYEPFFTTKPVGQGSGMGLAVVHGIIAICGGALQVTSSPGEGTTVEAYFPAAAGPDAAVTDEPGAVQRHGSGRILLVDDEAHIRRSTGMVLEQLGYDVTAVAGAPEALELFTRKPRAFDLLITDISMPDMDGFQLTQQIKELRPDMPVIMVTGYREKTTCQKTAAWGISAFMIKPFTRAELSKTIFDVLGQAR
jgi:signal transduction histidine kinase/CheY-like chemotaxis protein